MPERDFKPDYEALLKLSQYPEFKALKDVFEYKVKSARRKLDAKQTNDWQDVGFYRGFIGLIKYIYIIFAEAPEEVEKKIKQKTYILGGHK